MNSRSFSNAAVSANECASARVAARLRLAILGFALLLSAGCGPKGPALSSGDLKAFDSASPEVKQAWEKVLATDKANDYLTTQNLLDSLRQMPMDAGQSNAVEAESAAFGARLWQAAEKNEPTAVKAVQAINKSKGRR
jgi:hypothetical protein